MADSRGRIAEFVTTLIHAKSHDNSFSDGQLILTSSFAKHSSLCLFPEKGHCREKHNIWFPGYARINLVRRATLLIMFVQRWWAVHEKTYLWFPDYACSDSIFLKLLSNMSNRGYLFSFKSSKRTSVRFPLVQFYVSVCPQLLMFHVDLSMEI